MASKGTEFALCLNSANRDLDAYPEANDFVLDLKDRYDMQMVVLGSFEFPFNQMLIEAPWSEFSFDVGLSLPDLEARSLCVEDSYVVLLPAAFTQMRRATVASELFHAVTPSGAPMAHGLTAQTLREFPSARLLLRDGSGFESAQVTVVDAEHVRAATASQNLDALLVVAEANTRSFVSPEALTRCLRVFCAHPPAGAEALRALQWSYDAPSMQLRLAAQQPVALAEPGLLRALGFRVPSSFMLCDELVTSLCSALTVRLPPGNYEWAQLQRTTEHHMNSKAFLDLPAPDGPAARVYVWGGATEELLVPGPVVFFHPLAMVEHLNAALPSLTWSFAQDHFSCRRGDGKLFRMLWLEGAQMLALRLRMEDSYLCEELRGEPVDFRPVPTLVTLPSTHEGAQLATTKRFVFSARPKLFPGVPAALTLALSVVGGQLCLPIGQLPLETPLYLARGDEVAFGWLSRDDVASRVSVVQLLGPADLGEGWTASAVPALTPGAVNLYFPAAHGWSRLAEIFGMRSGANCWSGQLRAPHHWCLEQPSYVLLDLGLQHVSATISHRCGDDLLGQFFGKIVLYPPFKEMRMTPIQAVGTGVSVVSQLRLRILNPWHQLYQLHGRNWSFTVILASGTKGAHTDCL
jgi:hypothetical protein